MDFRGGSNGLSGGRWSEPRGGCLKQIISCVPWGSRYQVCGGPGLGGSFEPHGGGVRGQERGSDVGTLLSSPFSDIVCVECLSIGLVTKDTLICDRDYSNTPRAGGGSKEKGLRCWGLYARVV